MEMNQSSYFIADDEATRPHRITVLIDFARFLFAWRTRVGSTRVDLLDDCNGIIALSW